MISYKLVRAYGVKGIDDMYDVIRNCDYGVQLLYSMYHLKSKSCLYDVEHVVKMMTPKIMGLSGSEARNSTDGSDVHM